MMRRRGKRFSYRWYGDPGDGPLPGTYLASHRGRRAYLILGAEDRGRREATGRPHTLFRLTLQSVTRAEAFAAGNRVYELVWNRHNTQRMRNR